MCGPSSLGRALHRRNGMGANIEVVIVSQEGSREVSGVLPPLIYPLELSSPFTAHPRPNTSRLLRLTRRPLPTLSTIAGTSIQLVCVQSASRQQQEPRQDERAMSH